MVRYVVLCVLFGTVYTVVMGRLAALPGWIAAAGGAVFGLVSGFEGLILWNILKYGTEGIRLPLLKTVYHTAVGILFVTVAVGAETAAIYLANGTLTAAFMATIPARCLIIVAVYVCFALWYSSAARSEGDRERIPSHVPSPVNDGSAKKATAERPAILERITVRGSGGRIEVIETGRIVYLQAEGDYVAIVTPEGRWLKEGTMKYFEESLPRDRFVRVHRSYIVAVGHISRIETSGRDHTLILRAGGTKTHGTDSIRMSETGYRLLKRTLGL